MKLLILLICTTYAYNILITSPKNYESNIMLHSLINNSNENFYYIFDNEFKSIKPCNFKYGDHEYNIVSAPQIHKNSCDIKKIDYINDVASIIPEINLMLICFDVAYYNILDDTLSNISKLFGYDVLNKSLLVFMRLTPEKADKHFTSIKSEYPQIHDYIVLNNGDSIYRIWSKIASCIQSDAHPFRQYSDKFISQCKQSEIGGIIFLSLLFMIAMLICIPVRK